MTRRTMATEVDATNAIIMFDMLGCVIDVMVTGSEVEVIWWTSADEETETPGCLADTETDGKKEEEEQEDE